MSRYVRNTSVGTTLVEVLIALVILSLGMYANLRMLSQSISALNGAAQEQRALSQVRNLAELIRATSAEKNTDAYQAWADELARQLPGGIGQQKSIEIDGAEFLQLSVVWQGEANSPMQRDSYIASPVEP